jgi:hypothetical protein
MRFSYTDSDENACNLTISYPEAGQSTEPIPVGSGRSISRQAEGGAIRFQRTKSDVNRPTIGKLIEDDFIVTISSSGQLQHKAVASLGPAVLVFGAGMDYFEPDNIGWFSQLKASNNVVKLIQWVKKEFPLISDLEVLNLTGNYGLYAVMSDGARRRLTSVSSGISKIISILLAAACTRKGIIVIDEIENGIFYEKYPAVWKMLFDVAKETENQIFVSSHSAECLAALPDVIGENTSDFCLLRAEQPNGGSVVRHITGRAMSAALRGGNEVRGAT